MQTYHPCSVWVSNNRIIPTRRHRLDLAMSNDHHDNATRAATATYYEYTQPLYDRSSYAFVLQLPLPVNTIS